jgi:hypothetical protein
MKWMTGSILSRAVPVTLAVVVAVVAQAQPVIYPAKGQTPQLQQQDQGECQSWAKNQAAAAPSQPAPAPSGPQGGRVKGAARGAAIGAAGAAAGGGDTEKGAAGGAAAGAVTGGIKQRQGKQEQAQQAQQQQQQAATATTDKAFAACMEGRGYTVK